jgi:transposase InsO family protein
VRTASHDSDDHARIAFTDIYPDETKASAAQFVQTPSPTSALWASDCGASSPTMARHFVPNHLPRPRHQLRLKHSFTRPYRPQINGKAERFIQSALRGWAYGIPYDHSSQRTAMLERWIHHYNWHRRHQGINGLTPISRLAQSRNNLLTLRT